MVAETLDRLPATWLRRTQATDIEIADTAPATA